MILISKWKKLTLPVRAALAFTFSSLLIRGISFLTTPIFTRIMDTTQYGIVAAYNSWNSILEVFALLGLTSAGVFNAGLNDYKDSRDQYLSTMLALCNSATVLVFLVIFLVKKLFYSSFILPNELLLIMFISFLFQPAQIFWITRERYEYRYRNATIITIISTLFSQIIAICFIYFQILSNDSSNKVLGTAIGGLVFSIPIYLLLLYRGKVFLDTTIWRNTLVFALPLIPHYLAQHVMANADRIMIANLNSHTGAAIYAVVSAIGLISTVVWGAINASLVPYTYENMNNKEYSGIKSVTIKLIVTYAVICIIVSLIAPEALRILAPSNYYSGVYAVPPIVGVAFLNALYNLYATVEFYHKKSKGIAAATIVSCVINIALNYLLIPRFGFVASAYTTLISNIVLIMMHYYFYRRCQSVRVYNDKWFLIITLLCLLLCEFCSLLYVNDIVRYSFIIILIFILSIKRNTIIDLFKMLKENR